MGETTNQNVSSGAGDTTQPTADKIPVKFDLTPFLDIMKSVGIVIGSVGSIAAIFLWIGYAIIVARLRAYNLYGIVRYTDEYTTEAGYQFFQDMFTFFQDWKVVLLFIAVIIAIIITIPVGPFIGSRINPQPAKGIKCFFNIFGIIRRQGLNYLIFSTLAISACLVLVTNLPAKKLYSNIFEQEQLLSMLVEECKSGPLVFAPRKGADKKANTFQKIFYNELTKSEKPTREWLSTAITELNPEDRSDIRGRIIKFQQEFEIRESPDFNFNGDFDKSETYRTLLNIRLSSKLNVELPRKIDKTLADIHMLLGRILTSEDGESFSTLVAYTANNRPVNDSIQELGLYRENVEVFFDHKDSHTANIINDLKKLRKFNFGQFFLSYAFWTLVGIFIYLVINSTRIINFKQWELGYFATMALIFLTIIVTLPTTYGRYKYEFKVLKLNDIVFAGDEKGENPVRKKLDQLKSRDAGLYILGPTKGKEVILGAIKTTGDSAVNTPQIIMMDRETVKYMNVEPLRARDIPDIIALFRQSR